MSSKDRAKRNEAARAYYWRHHAVMSVRQAEQYQKHKTKRLTANASYRVANRHRLNLACKEWYAKNRTEQLRKYHSDIEGKRRAARERYWNKREKIMAQKATWRKLNHSKVNGYSAKWRRAHRDVDRERQRRRIAANPEINRQDAAKRRARVRGATIGDTKKIVAWIGSWQNKKSVICYWCGERFPGKSCHADHIAPLKKGGSHSVGNLCVACPTCNGRKGATLPHIWNQSLQQPRLFL